MSLVNPNSNVVPKQYETRFVKVENDILPTLEITSNPHLSLDAPGIKFTVKGAPDEWNRFIEKAYLDELQNPQNPSYDPYASQGSTNSNSSANRKTVRPIFDRKNAVKLPKINKTRQILIEAMLLDATGDFAAKSKPFQIELPEEYLFETTYRIDCDPKRWKILLNFGQKGERPSSTPMTIYVVEVVCNSASPRLNLDYRQDDLDKLSRELDLVSLDEQFRKLSGAIISAQCVEDEFVVADGQNSLHRWTYAIKDFTFSFQPKETLFLRRKYLQGDPIVIPVKLTCDCAEPIPFEIEILPFDKLCVETLAIDLGSSVSTACFTSPKFDRTIIGAGLPNEQLNELRVQLIDWFERPKSKELEDFWRRFVLSVANELGDSDQKNNNLALQYIVKFLKGNEREFYGCWLAIENSLSGVPNVRPLYAQTMFQEDLYKIYDGVLSRFPFENRSVRTADLENKQRQIVSEFCFDSKANAFWAQGRMGKAVSEERLSRVLKDESTDRYFPNPKSKIYELCKNTSADDEVYSPRQVYQGALDKLISIARSELTKNVQETRDAIPTLVLTYPVTLTAQSRRKLADAACQLGFPRVKIVDRYDESVAPAIFYLDKYFGNFDELGPEAFKMKCSYARGVWRHNMLIVDVGAGTTDISLIQVEMREETPTEETAKKLGGRVYKITPTLLGALGYDQVGGNLATLYVYHFLKTLLARFFAKIKEGNDLNVFPKNLNDVRLCFDDFYNQESELRKSVEQCVPTYTKEQNGDKAQDYKERIKRFTWLWQWAEKVKIAFSERKKRELECKRAYPDLDLFEGAPEVGLEGLEKEFKEPQSDFAKAFLYSYYGSGGEKDKFMEFVRRHRADLVFPNSKFEELANDFVEKIVQRASEVTTKALETRLGVLQKKYGNNISGLIEACQGVHSVVLSGRSSKLPWIKKRFEKEIDDSCRSFLRNKNEKAIPFARPQTKIIFEDEYAKTATVVGAVRAHEITRGAYLNVENNSYVNAGRCYRYLDVKNLTHNLSSSFTSNGASVFELQKEFSLCDFDGRERIRSAGGFVSPSSLVQIKRCIGNQISNQQYAKLDFNVLREGLGKNINLSEFLVSYEIDPELNVYALIKKGRNEPTYDLSVTPNQYRTRIEKKFIDALFEERDGRFVLNYDVCVGRNNISNDFALVFPEGTELDKNGVVKPTNVCEGAFKRIKFATSGDYLKVQDVVCRTLTFYFIKKNRERKPLGTIDLTPEPCDRRPWEDRLRVALTSEGELVSYVGDEPDYWETKDAEEWSKNSDMILRRNITDGSYGADRSLDPFNGRQ